MSIAILLVWVLALEVHRTREETVLGIGSEEYKRVLDATLGVFGGIAIIVILLGIDVVRSHFALALPAGALLLLINRWQWRAWLNRQRLFGHYLSKVIVVGEPSDVEYVIRQFGKVSGAAYEVVGAALPAGYTESHLQISAQTGSRPVRRRLGRGEGRRNRRERRGGGRDGSRAAPGPSGSWGGPWKAPGPASSWPRA